MNSEKQGGGARPERFWQLTAILAIAAAAVFAFLWLSGMGQTGKEPEPLETLPAEQPAAQMETASGQPEAEAPRAAATKVPSAEELDISGISIAGRKIVVDPGHGNGVKSGTASAVSGRSEGDINLEIALKLRDKLQAEGATVVMTRETKDALADNYEADMKAREEVIRGANADLFISVHQNEFEDAAASGPQVFFVEQGSVGKRLAVAIQDMLNFELEREVPRMALEAAYRVLKTGSQPSCTVECGFLSNPDEAAQLESEEYQQKIADAITDGVKLYVKRFG